MLAFNLKHCVNANTLIGADILFPGHPYIWARYRKPIIHPSYSSEMKYILQQKSCMRIFTRSTCMSRR